MSSITPSLIKLMKTEKDQKFESPKDKHKFEAEMNNIIDKFELGLKKKTI
jgi:hypothetical protein